MNCPMENLEHVQRLLDYRAGRLEPESAARLEEHIATCGACREFASGQRAVWEALDGWETGGCTSASKGRFRGGNCCSARSAHHSARLRRGEFWLPRPRPA